MGMPEIVVSFRSAAETAVKRSARGIVAVIITDSTTTNAVTRINSATDISALFTTGNAALIKAILTSGAESVLAVRTAAGESGSGVDMAKTLKQLEGRVFNWLVYPDAESADTAAIVTWIKAQRAAGKTYKAIVCDATSPDSAGIVNFCASGLVRGTTSIDSGEYAATLAGLLAGTPLSQSVTYTELGDITACDAVSDMDTAVDAGKLIVFYDREKYMLGRGVTSSTTGSEYEKKIKLVEGVDIIAQDIRDIFVDEYVGKVANSYDNKQVFVAAVGAYLDALKGSVLDPDYDVVCEIDADAQAAYLEEKGTDTSKLSRTEILKANTGSKVFLSVGIKLLDAMEDMTLVIAIDYAD